MLLLCSLDTEGLLLPETELLPEAEPEREGEAELLTEPVLE